MCEKEELAKAVADEASEIAKLTKKLAEIQSKLEEATKLNESLLRQTAKQDQDEGKSLDHITS